MPHDRNLIHTQAAPHLEDLATHLQRAREQERAHLARELHDELGALLMAAKLDVACLKVNLGSVTPEIARRLAHLAEILNGGIALKSKIVEGLCPSTLAHWGLVVSLENLARDFGLTSGIEIGIDLEAVSLDDVTQLTVYRLVQECLTNVAKYSGATKAQVVLLNRQREVMVVVLDNGAGFDVDHVSDTRHGLRGIAHRVESCGGRLSVTSTPRHGTRVEAMLPGGSAGTEVRTLDFDTTVVQATEARLVGGLIPVLDHALRNAMDSAATASPTWSAESVFKAVRERCASGP